MDYETVIQKIIEKQEDTIGDIARKRAENIEIIEIEDGEIKFNGEAGKSDVKALMDEYKEIQGQGAIGIAKKAVSEALDGDTDIDLPEEILPKEVKEERFASAI
ncbi:MAG: hypothetical protein ABEJ93_03105 [Candidatus Nanohalobium sp.]